MKWQKTDGNIIEYYNTTFYSYWNSNIRSSFKNHLQYQKLLYIVNILDNKNGSYSNYDSTKDSSTDAILERENKKRAIKMAENGYANKSHKNKQL